jgi:hypothetical protein
VHRLVRKRAAYVAAVTLFWTAQVAPLANLHTWDFETETVELRGGANTISYIQDIGAARTIVSPTSTVTANVCSTPEGTHKPRHHVLNARRHRSGENFDLRGISRGFGATVRNRKFADSHEFGLGRPARFQTARLARRDAMPIYPCPSPSWWR